MANDGTYTILAQINLKRENNSYSEYFGNFQYNVKAHTNNLSINRVIFS